MRVSRVADGSNYGGEMDGYLVGIGAVLIGAGFLLYGAGRVITALADAQNAETGRERVKNSIEVEKELRRQVETRGDDLAAYLKETMNKAAKPAARVPDRPPQ